MSKTYYFIVFSLVFLTSGCSASIVSPRKRKADWEREGNGEPQLKKQKIDPLSTEEMEQFSKIVKEDPARFIYSMPSFLPEENNFLVYGYVRKLRDKRFVVKELMSLISSYYNHLLDKLEYFIDYEPGWHEYVDNEDAACSESIFDERYYNHISNLKKYYIEDCYLLCYLDHKPVMTRLLDYDEYYVAISYQWPYDKSLSGFPGERSFQMEQPTSINYTEAASHEMSHQYVRKVCKFELKPSLLKHYRPYYKELIGKVIEKMDVKTQLNLVSELLYFGILDVKMTCKYNECQLVLYPECLLHEGKCGYRPLITEFVLADGLDLINHIETIEFGVYPKKEKQAANLRFGLGDEIDEKFIIKQRKYNQKRGLTVCDEKAFEALIKASHN